MKTLKINLVAVFAIVFALSTMSFKMYQNESQDEVWFPVDELGAIGDTALPGDPEDIDCSQLITVNVCAVQLPEEHTFTNINQTGDAPKAGRNN